MEDGYVGSIGSTAVWVARRDGGIEVRSALEQRAVRAYFDIDRDYSAVLSRYDGEPLVGRTTALCAGLHVLNQPVWEALVAFLFSQHNNVARITLLMDKLCRACGERVEIEGREVWLMPSPERVAELGEDGLRALGAGYRAPYVHRAALSVLGGFRLNELASMQYERALECLMTLHGVGEKVADCVLLFGCGHSRAFPVDRWVARALSGHFPNEKNLKRLKALAVERLGEHAGIANQYMFHCARVGLLEGGVGA